MKKLLLGLGAAASVIAPIAAVVACGDEDKKVTWNGVTASNVFADEDSTNIDDGLEGKGSKVSVALTTDQKTKLLAELTKLVLIKKTSAGVFYSGTLTDPGTLKTAAVGGGAIVGQALTGIPAGSTVMTNTTSDGKKLLVSSVSGGKTIYLFSITL